MRARVPVFGLVVDDQTRCAHWHGETDVIAMRFACCDRYYPCYDCHAETADHPSSLWPVGRFDEPAVLCGVCGSELTATTYRAISALTAPACPHCAALFNPGCALHAPLYFEPAP